MATARRLLVDPAEGGVFHCTARCVRRAYLCGWDELTKRSFEHRRAWVRDRVKELAGVFGVHVFAYAVMSNHLHVVLSTDPKGVTGWTDEEVARRWLTLFPGPGGRRGRPPEAAAVATFCQDPERLARCRGRLADVSWFMRCLNEPIARRANREDDCKGRFWEGRFHCQRLEDPGALLACMTYVDLNPVRARLAVTPEASEFTSAQDRSLALCARRQLAVEPTADKTPTAAQEVLRQQACAESSRDQWLVPFPPPKSPATLDDPRTWLYGLGEEEYLKVLDQTGRQIRTGKRGHLPDDLRPVLERLDLDVEEWVDTVARYGSLFHRLTGKLSALRTWARAKKLAWLHGHRGARLLYAKTA